MYSCLYRYDVADFVAVQLRGGAVQTRLEDLASSNGLPSWLTDDDGKTFFEMQVCVLCLTKL